MERKRSWGKQGQKSWEAVTKTGFQHKNVAKKNKPLGKKKGSNKWPAMIHDEKKKEQKPAGGSEAQKNSKKYFPQEKKRKSNREKHRKNGGGGDPKKKNILQKKIGKGTKKIEGTNARDTRKHYETEKNYNSRKKAEKTKSREGLKNNKQKLGGNEPSTAKLRKKKPDTSTREKYSRTKQIINKTFRKAIRIKQKCNRLKEIQAS